MGEFSETSIIVRYAETDRMGIVHHSNYPVWFEAGRTDFIKKVLGISYSELERQGLLLPLISLSCNFKKPAGYEDEVIIRTRIEEAGVVRLKFSYEVFDAKDGSLLTAGTTEHAWTGPSFKPVNIKKKSPEFFEALKSCVHSAAPGQDNAGKHSSGKSRK